MQAAGSCTIRIWLVAANCRSVRPVSELIGSTLAINHDYFISFCFIFNPDFIACPQTGHFENVCDIMLLHDSSRKNTKLVLAL